MDSLGYIVLENTVVVLVFLVVLALLSAKLPKE